MELYVKVSFICIVIGVVLRVFLLSCAGYPRREEVSVGRDLLSLLTNIGVGCWAGYLLFLK